MNTSTTDRLAMLQNGFKPVPIRTGLKYPTVADWPGLSAAATPASLAKWATEIPNHGGTGVLCGEVVGLDLDALDADLSFDLEMLAGSMLGDTPLRRVGQAPKVLLVYRAGDPAMRKLSTPPLLLNGSKTQVECLAAGEQFVAFGIHPDTSKPYAWSRATPANTALASLPVVTESSLRAFLEAAETMMRAAGATGNRKGVSASSTAAGKRDRSSLAPPNAAIVVALFNRMPNPLEVDYDRFTRIMFGAVGCIQGLQSEGRCTDDDAEAIQDAACSWASRWEGAAVNDPYEKWESDWSRRKAPLAGWRTVQDEARKLIPEYAAEAAAGEFADDLPPEIADPDDWMGMLQRGKPPKVKEGDPFVPGPIKGNLTNALIAFDNAPEWKGHLAFNTFANVVVVDNRRFADHDTTRATQWLQTTGINVVTTTTHEALVASAMRNPMHPVCDYLDGLQWDGTARIDTWLIDHLGAEDTQLNRAVGSRFLLSMVARVRRPGCKVDTVLILESAQGRKKSTALQILANGWFTDHLPDIASKDAAIQLMGVWLLEVAEMDKMNRADVSRVKSFISTAVDRFRKPFGRIAEDVPRQTVIAASVNPGSVGYLQDETGNRRYWPVTVGATWPTSRQVDTVALTAARSQIWAEAQHRYAAGAPWWLDTEDLDAAQRVTADKRFAEDVWTDRVREYIAELDEVKIPDILTGCLSMPAERWNENTMKRVGRILRAEGWDRRRARRDGKLVMAFFRSGYTSTQVGQRAGNADNVTPIRPALSVASLE